MQIDSVLHTKMLKIEEVETVSQQVGDWEKRLQQSSVKSWNMYQQQQASIKLIADIKKVFQQYAKEQSFGVDEVYISTTDSDSQNPSPLHAISIVSAKRQPLKAKYGMLIGEQEMMVVKCLLTAPQNLDYEKQRNVQGAGTSLLSHIAYETSKRKLPYIALGSKYSAERFYEKQGFYRPLA